jgi:hypothetical protein
VHTGNWHDRIKASRTRKLGDWRSSLPGFSSASASPRSLGMASRGPGLTPRARSGLVWTPSDVAVGARCLSSPSRS